MSAIECSGLRHSYGDTLVLDGVDLSIEANSVVAVIGRSGSGKSTLLRLIAGFERVRDGSIAFDGETVSSAQQHLPTHKRRVGYVPQDAALFPHLTVAANIAFGIGRRERKQVDKLIELVGLNGLGDRYPHQLSGGQQQRVALARALAIRPRVLLLDEPFAALDASLRTSLRREVLDILREQGTTTILVTHDQAEALSSADQLAFIHDGVIRQNASPAEVYTHPADREVATFLGEANIVPGRHADARITTALGELTPAAPCATGSVDVLIRPEQIHLSVGDSADQHLWEIVSAEYFGHDTLYRVQPPPGADLPSAGLLVRSADATDLRPGDLATIIIDGAVTAWPHRRP